MVLQKSVRMAAADEEDEQGGGGYPVQKQLPQLNEAGLLLLVTRRRR